jgi:hypothetical protein
MLLEEAMPQPRPLFTIFGGSFIAEKRDPAPPARKPADRLAGPLIVVLLAGLLGATIPAVAITKVSSLRAAEAARWKQPTYFLKAPPAVGFSQAVF